VVAVEADSVLKLGHAAVLNLQQQIVVVGIEDMVVRVFSVAVSGVCV
jgi:hypothetical protein